jgi:hypothetical protein
MGRGLCGSGGSAIGCSLCIIGLQDEPAVSHIEKGHLCGIQKCVTNIS